MKNPKLFLFLFLYLPVFSQNEYPQPFPAAQKTTNDWSFFTDIPQPPPMPVRHAAEWEEMEALVVTWRSFRSVLREIIRYAKEEVKVIITYDPEATLPQYNSATAIEEYLINGGVDLNNLTMLPVPSNSVWTRDYLQTTVYANDVEDRYFIDWVYDRNRPKDDTISNVIGHLFNIPVYSMTQPPTRIAHAGGNFLSDGLGTAFSSKLILDDNAPGNPFGAGPHTEAAIDSIHQLFLGINRYIKFETLPYDIIHHIDMHMHLLDEETILWGQYPEGVADGPQIEANIQYLLDNYLSAFGTPYEIKRIIQPPDFDGAYPNTFGDYRTYTNFVFINKTIIVPFYEEQYDTIAQRFFEEYFPGYKIVGINCNEMISAVGALHCIVKEVPAADPLWIVHRRQKDIANNDDRGDYEITATIRHRSGVETARVFWTTDTTAGYLPLNMYLTDTSSHIWSAKIPHQTNGTKIFYYIAAQAFSGKSQTRPLPAPQAFYHFTVKQEEPSATLEKDFIKINSIYPNPATAITVVPVATSRPVYLEVILTNALGNFLEVLYSGKTGRGNQNIFFDAGKYIPGIYFIILKSDQQVFIKKIIIN